MFFISGHSGMLVNAGGNIDRFTINKVKITCGSIHEGHEWFSDYSRGRQESFMCLAALLCENFADSRTEVPRYRSSQSYFVRSFFCLSVFSSSEVLVKICTYIRSKLPTAACWSREEKRGNCEANLL